MYPSWDAAFLSLNWPYILNINRYRERKRRFLETVKILPVILAVLELIVIFIILFQLSLVHLTSAWYLVTVVLTISIFLTSKALHFCKWHKITVLYSGISFLVFMEIFTDWVAVIVIVGAIFILYEFFSHVYFGEDPPFNNE